MSHARVCRTGECFWWRFLLEWSRLVSSTHRFLAWLVLIISWTFMFRWYYGAIGLSDLQLVAACQCRCLPHLQARDRFLNHRKRLSFCRRGTSRIIRPLIGITNVTYRFFIIFDSDVLLQKLLYRYRPAGNHSFCRERQSCQDTTLAKVSHFKKDCNQTTTCVCDIFWLLISRLN